MPQNAGHITIESHTENDLFFNKAVALIELATNHWKKGEPTTALANAIEALQLLNHLQGTQAVLLHTASAYHILGTIYIDQLQLPDANNSFREELHIYSQLAFRNPEETLPIVTKVIEGLTATYLDNPLCGLSFEEVLPQITTLFDNHSKELTPVYAMMLTKWGRLNIVHKQFDPAQEVLKQSLYLYQVLAAGNPGNYTPLLAQTIQIIGDLKQQTGLSQEAEKLFFQAKDLFESAILPNTTSWYEDLANLLQLLADIQQRQDKPEHAIDFLIAASKLLEILTRQSSSHYIDQLINCYNKCGNIMKNDFRNLAQAELYFNKAAALKA